MSIRVAVGLALGSCAMYSIRRPPVFCEPLAYKNSRVVESRGIQRFHGALDYHQLALGSFTGMVSGWFVGKVSKMAVTLVFGGLLGLEWLQYLGIVDLTPFASAVYRWGVTRINTELVIKDPSFKWSFFAAFLVAAFNS